jgi:hypothetical protein
MFGQEMLIHNKVGTCNIIYSWNICCSTFFSCYIKEQPCVWNQTQLRLVSCVVHQEMYKTQIDELMARKGE